MVCREGVCLSLGEGLGSGKLREPLLRSRRDRAGAAPSPPASRACVLDPCHWRASASAAEAMCAGGKGTTELFGATHRAAPFPASWEASRFCWLVYSDQ